MSSKSFVDKICSHMYNITHLPSKVGGFFEFSDNWVYVWPVKKSFAPLVVCFLIVWVLGVALVNCRQDVMLSLVEIAAIDIY